MGNRLELHSACVAWWRFEPGSLTADSRDSFPLTAVGSPLSATVRREGQGSAALNGNSGFSLAVPLDSTFPLRPRGPYLQGALAAWCLTQSRSPQVLCAYRGTEDHFRCRLTADGLEVLWNGGTDLQERWQTGWHLTPGEWYHLALDFSSEERYVRLQLYQPRLGYLDQRQYCPRQELCLPPGTFYLGCHPQLPGWQGYLDETVVWNTPQDGAAYLQVAHGLWQQAYQVQLDTAPLRYPGFPWDRTFWQ